MSCVSYLATCDINDDALCIIIRHLDVPSLYVCATVRTIIL